MAASLWCAIVAYLEPGLRSGQNISLSSLWTEVFFPDTLVLPSHQNEQFI